MLTRMWTPYQGYKNFKKNGLSHFLILEKYFPKILFKCSLLANYGLFPRRWESSNCDRYMKL